MSPETLAAPALAQATQQASSQRIQQFAASARQAARREALIVLGWQLALFGGLLALWESLTRVPWFVENTFIDPFFVSRPSLVIQRIYDWTLGSQAGFVLPHLSSTVVATMLGLVVSVATGFVAGLSLSQSPRLARVLGPFITAANSLPRIAFVPLITMIFGLGLLSKVVTAWFLVFFLVFFNTFKGGQSIEPHIINFCRTLGASRTHLLWSVRVPYVMGWMFAALPNAVAFSLVGVVISEFVGSDRGMGYLIITSLSTLNATDMFATITVLSVLGVALVAAIRQCESRLMRWTPEFREGQ
ncbi:ABC transporter permease [Xenophilus sp. Marseille-Q4582]|uniref:ABC transporter permease n=1 Tax=Xenophilus sp. Marseille-Q4582 TaxID=2866600 RepID=UPI001CE41F00|nr:ABC transporter permease [Xenophilus sp. Marseille-Q4582]